MREGEMGKAFRLAVQRLHLAPSLATSLPLYSASEDRLLRTGVLGPVWRHVPTDGERTAEGALATLGEVAAFLRVPPKTLYQWRYSGLGPPAYRVGRHLRFRWDDVEEWLEERGDMAAPSRGPARPKRVMCRE